jgi:hypothetical protein
LYCLTHELPVHCTAFCFQAAWDADDEVLAAAIRNIDASISGALLAFNYRTDNPLGECAAAVKLQSYAVGHRIQVLIAGRAVCRQCTSDHRLMIQS